MNRSTLTLAVIAAAAIILNGCEDPDNFNKTDRKGRLIEISGRIGQVATRVAVPEPGDSPLQHYRLRFDELESGNYTIHMRVEKLSGDEPVTFDVAQARVSADGWFRLTLPATIDPAWLAKVPDGFDMLWNESNRYLMTPEGLPDGVPDRLPDVIEISNPEVDMCVAYLYMERAGDGQRYWVYYGGPDKRSDHVTDLSSVSTSHLLYTSEKVSVNGRTNGPMPNRGFDVETNGGWSWLHSITNGMSQYLGWHTAWPEWAVMDYSARAIYED